MTIVEGESLVNDATGLTLYKLAVAAAVGSGVTLLGGAGTFVVNAVGGIAFGLVAAWLLARVRARVEDAPTEIVVSLLSPYLAYLPAEAAGVSAVLAAVTCGVVLGWRSPELVAPATRLQSFATWEVVVFAVEAGIFVLVGLSLPTVVQRIDGAALGTLVRDGAAVVATVVAVRFAWTFVVGALPRLLRAAARARRRAALGGGPARGFTGMRGAVSVAAALAIPLQTDAGDASARPRPDHLPDLRRGRRHRRGAGARAAAAAAPDRPRGPRRPGRARGGRGPRRGRPRRARAPRRARRRRRVSRTAPCAACASSTASGWTASRRGWRATAGRTSRRTPSPTSACGTTCSSASGGPSSTSATPGGITDDALRRVEHDLDLDESRLELSEGVGPHGASPLQLGDGD